MQIDVAYRSHDRLGECPLWHAGERALYWIDGLAPLLHRLDGAGRHQSWPMSRPIGSFGFRTCGGLVGAFTGGFASIDLEAPATIGGDGQLKVDLPGHILNDGKCDRWGRFWSGSRAGDLVSPEGSLFRLGADLRYAEMDKGFAVSNGIAWSPDDRTMYFADSPASSIYAYDFDPEEGEIRNRRLFASTAALGGVPDGAAVDADGHYWSALFGGSAIARYDASARLVATIRLPVKNPTMCSFGGDNLDVLFVTSARVGLSEHELAEQPLAGVLLAVSGLGVRGLAEPFFSG